MSGEKSLLITESFLSAIKLYPDKTLFHYYLEGWKRMGYAEFSESVFSLSSFLTRSGMKRGTKAAIVSENRPQWCSAYFAILMAGGVAVPVDPQLGPNEWRNLFSDSEARIIFFSDKTSSDVLDAVEAMGSGRPLAINFDSADYKTALGTAPLPSFPENGPDDLASIIYTSGTTGDPKGVMLTHANFCSDAYALIEAGVVSHEDNVLSVLPLHHTYAFMCTFLVPFFLGASITYPSSMKGPDLVSAIKENGVSVVVAVPQLLAMIRNGIIGKVKDLRGAAPALVSAALRISRSLRRALNINIGRTLFRSAHAAFGDRLRFFTSGGASLDPEVMKDLEGVGFTVLEGYGLTESSPVITFNPVTRRKPGSAGKALPGAEIKIKADSREDEGEILVRGPMVMNGYYKRPDETEKVLRDGWLNTGDIGHIDKGGYLFITGRSKEVIVLSSGKNVYPEEVEKLYLSAPIIKEICVLAVNKNGKKEKLHAVIVPDFEYARTNRVPDIQQAMKEQAGLISAGIPPYMRIAGFSLQKEPLPRTPLGKMRRYLVYEELSRKREDHLPTHERRDFTDYYGNRISEIFLRVTARKTISADDNLELDLGLDSLAKIEVIAALETAFSTRLPEDFLLGVQTIGDVIEKMKGRGAKEEKGPSAEAGLKEILSSGPSEGDLHMVTLVAQERKMPLIFFIHTLLRICLKLLFRVEVRGIGNIPREGNFIMAANHTSYLDGPAVILCLPFLYFKRIYSLGLREFFTGFVKSRIAKLAHVIPIDSALYLQRALQVAAYVVNQGRSLLVFPEGGRSLDGELMPFKKGIGVLALELGPPVIPVYIQGAFEALPRGSVVPRFKKITITFCPPLYAKDIDLSKRGEDLDDYQYFANILRLKIEDAARLERKKLQLNI